MGPKSTYLQPPWTKEEADGPVRRHDFRKLKGAYWKLDEGDSERTARNLFYSPKEKKMRPTRTSPWWLNFIEEVPLRENSRNSPQTGSNPGCWDQPLLPLPLASALFSTYQKKTKEATQRAWLRERFPSRRAISLTRERTT